MLCCRAMDTRRCLRSFLMLFTLAACPVSARVTRVEIVSRADVLDGKSFGVAGAYERITGRVYFSAAAANAHNRSIVDLDKAGNLRDGEGDFAADFTAV